MSYWIDETGTDNMKTSSSYRMYKCDTVADIKNLPTYKKKGKEQDDDISASKTCIYGSECYCIENDTYYILTKDSDSWKAKPSASAGGQNINLEEYAKKTDIPKSLPASDVHDWAKQETKPTYNATEVGAIPSTKESQYDAAVKQANNNKSDIDVIKGSGEGSITKSLSDAKAYADGLGSKYATSAQGKKADTSVQSVKMQGSDTELKSGTNVVIPAFPINDASATTTSTWSSSKIQQELQKIMTEIEGLKPKP